jgi:hypothetical protein
MQEAFIVLRRAIQDAERRQRQYESEGDKSKHKLIPRAARDPRPRRSVQLASMVPRPEASTHSTVELSRGREQKCADTQ